MTDAAISWDDDIRQGDLGVRDFDLAHEDGLRSAVLISLFTDARASEDELPEGESDRRGWWGDALSDGDATGSLIWLLEREKETPEVAARAEAYAREALAWMVTDGVATAVAVSAAWVARGRLEVEAAITLPDGSAVEMQFNAGFGDA